jgi:hypothetical protein
MIQREIVRRCVHFQNPERIAYFCSRFGLNDIVNVFDFFRKDENGFDPWGIQWDIAEEENVATMAFPKRLPLKTNRKSGRSRYLTRSFSQAW